MLVLSRKDGESVCISHGIQVKVLSIRGGTVKLGFEAPADIVIRREEISETVETTSPHVAPKRAIKAPCLAGAS
jgi:carbon storage regulator